MPLNYFKGNQGYVGMSMKYQGGFQYLLHLRCTNHDSTALEVAYGETYQDLYMNELDREYPQ